MRTPPLTKSTQSRHRQVIPSALRSQRVEGGRSPHPGGDARACTSKQAPRADEPSLPGRGYDRRVLRLTYATFSCDEPQRLAEFWSAVLGYEARAHRGESWEATDPLGENVSLLFNRMPKSPTIEVPIHLDVNVPDREAEVERIVGLGARGIVETKTMSIGTLTETWTVMRDPEGNGFCVQGPDPRKPHPYVGNVTFSSASPRKLGAFWSGALDWPEQDVPADFLQMLREAHLDPDEFEAYYSTLSRDGRRPRLLFQRREKSRPESYPLHLDFASDDRESEIERLTRTGASIVETKTNAEETWTVMRDPEGNPFCVA